MIINNIKTAFRTILKELRFNIINVFGLAIGLSCIVLVTLYAYDELNMESFHKKRDRIYRILRETETSDGGKNVSSGTSTALAEALEAEFPEIESATRILSWGGVTMNYDEKFFNHSLCLADPGIFEMFTFPILHGDPEDLNKPNTIFLSEEMAQAIFGEKDPIGEILEIVEEHVDGNYEIVGIIRDIPDNTIYDFDCIASSVNNETFNEEWKKMGGFMPITTCVLLKEGFSSSEFEKKLSIIVDKYLTIDTESKNKFYAQPLKRIYLHSRSDYNLQQYSNPTQMYIFIALGIFILIIACLNYINLVTARFIKRFNVIGIKKVLGCKRSDIIREFLTETLLISILSLIIALLIVLFILPAFNSLIYKDIQFRFSPLISLILLSIVILTGFSTGFLPALTLASFNPRKDLNSGTGIQKDFKRRFLVILQFIISIILIISTLVIKTQSSYLLHRDMGFEKDNILITPFYWFNRSLCDQNSSIKQEFLRNPEITAATASYASVIFGGQVEPVIPEGDVENVTQMGIIGIDEDFFGMYGIDIVAGRDFSEEFPSDKVDAYIINETAVKRFGWTDPIGKQLKWRDRYGTVVGIAQDHNNRSLREEIMPSLYCIRPFYNSLAFKLAGNNTEQTIKDIEEIWEKYIDRPFSYYFLDQQIENQYFREKRIMQVIGIFSLLGIFIACLGLFGLTLFHLERKTKEIAIRKINGARPPQILWRILKGYLVSILLSAVVAFPVSYILMNNWLNNYAYKITMPYLMFVLALMICASIAILTVFTQTLRVIKMKAIDSLRLE